MKKSRTNIRRIIALLLTLCLAMQVGMTGAWAQETGESATSTVYSLKTESTVNPLGIDVEQPGFSWKMDSTARSAYQTAYQVKVALSEEALRSGDLLWDSGKITSDQSLKVLYGGPALAASTRYYWTVTIWDQDGNYAEADEAAWFETGLMGSDASVWNGADWIGSPIKTTNTSALSRYVVAADVQVLEGGKAGFVVNGRNKDNYVLFEVDFVNRLIKVSEYCDNAWGGSYEDGNVPTVKALGDANGYAIPEEAVAAGTEADEHRVEITAGTVKSVVETPWGQMQRDVAAAQLTIDGVEVIPMTANLLPSDPNNQPRKAQLMSIGFKQLDGKALYDNLLVKNGRTEDIYQDEDFSDESGAMAILGKVQDGKLLVDNTFELACPVPAVNVKDTFEVTKEVASARLYAAAQGFYDAYINGEKAGEDFYNPGFTDYRLRIQYQTFDVTDMLRQGENMIGAIVGKGWFSGYCGYSGAMKYGEENTFIAQLVINYSDGTKDIIVTDDSWKYTDKGPVVDSDYLDGEQYDARMDFDGWGEPAYDDSAWVSCGVKGWPDTVKPTNGTLSEEVAFQLSAQVGPTAKIERELTPIAVVENPSGHYVYDFGQNMVGTIRLTVKGEEGTSLKIRYGEMSYQNGEIYIKNVRNAANTDTYTLKGDPDGETFIPSLTSHGFRYVEITGNGFDLDSSDIVVSIEGLVLCNVEEVTGGFECSNELINQLQSNIQWGQRGNYLLVPTDCPQRNERMGWTGDAQVFAGTAAYNMDVAQFTKKWLQDVIDGQLMYNKQGAVPDTAPLGGDNRSDGCAGWGDAGVMVPWSMYQAYGDVSILEECYDMMAKWIAYQSQDSRQNYGVRTVNRVEVPEQSDLASIPFIQVQQRRGDHLTFDESTPFILTATAYAAHVSDLMSQIAGILGKEDDAAMYRERFENIKQAFNEAWVQEDGSIAYWGEMSKGGKDVNGNVINQTYYSNADDSNAKPSQTAYAVAIDFGLIPEEKLARATECFKESIEDRDGHLSVGFLGIAHLAPALSEVGLTNLAFDLLEQEGNPGWLYSVVNGATTIWERWNSYISETDTFGDVSMNSFNHYSYGAIGEWMYDTILGIDKDEPGYKSIVLQPTFGGSLTYANGWHESFYGTIESAWSIDGNSFTYEATVPANTTATLYLPTADAASIYEGSIPAAEADGVEYLGIVDGRAAYKLGSGSYSFSSNMVQTVNADGETVDCAAVNEDFSVKVLTSSSVQGVRLFNESSMSIAAKAVSCVDNGDGTKLWTITTSLGTVGDGRSLIITTQDKEGVLSDHGQRVNIAIKSVPPVIESLDLPDSAVANRTFIVKATTDLAAAKIAVYNEYGTKMGIKALSYRIVDGKKVWTGVMSIGTKGARTFHAYAVNKYGVRSETAVTDSITVAAFA